RPRTARCGCTWTARPPRSLPARPPARAGTAPPARPAAPSARARPAPRSCAMRPEPATRSCGDGLPVAVLGLAPLDDLYKLSQLALDPRQLARHDRHVDENEREEHQIRRGDVLARLV